MSVTTVFEQILDREHVYPFMQSGRHPSIDVSHNVLNKPISSNAGSGISKADTTFFSSNIHK